MNSIRRIRRPVSARALSRVLLCATLLGLLSLSVSGCATRVARESVVDRKGLDVDLLKDRKGLFGTVEKSYEHPAVISAPRMAHILSAVEVETREKKGGVIRQPAIHPDLLKELSEALADAYAVADKDQEISVKIVRKEARLGIFHAKYLTSFLSYIDDGYLYILLSRVDWPIPQAKEEDKLPEPTRGKSQMNFRVVSGEHLFYAGPQALEIDWQDPIFRRPYRLPGSTSGEKRRREVLLKAPIPREELEAAPNGGVSLDQLSPEQLRALADLEEDRRAGRITETAYQRAKRQLLRKR